MNDHEEGPPTPRMPPTAAPRSTAGSEEGSQGRRTAFFCATLAFLHEERLLTLKALLQTLPLGELADAFADDTSPAQAHPQGIAPPNPPARSARFSLFLWRPAGYFGEKASPCSLGHIGQLTQQHLLSDELDEDAFLRAFPFADWVPRVSAESAWLAIATCHACWTPGQAQREHVQRESGIRPKDASRPHAMQILMAATSSGFVSPEGIETSPDRDPLALAFEMSQGKDAAGILADILAPAARQHGISNAFAAWNPERKTVPDCPRSIFPPKASA